MSISLSDLIPHKSNQIAGYDRLYHTRRYFMGKALQIPCFKKRLIGTRYEEIQDFYGYKYMQKFFNQLKQWNSLRVPIPVRYLEAIEIDYKVLEFYLEIDHETYLDKLNEPHYPKYANVRSGIHTVTFELPNVMEGEAISYMREVIAGESKAPFYIEYEDFLTIKIVSGEAPVYYYRIPGLHRKGNFYCFTEC
ncbi:hypothetical protein [Marispirochaeta aestuarii]|uniref:hypothetical protein n=1 Tax=Marispirochaeta aestuarii TaxID=1963862 RepID=UPI002ABDD1E6|nr:hypothetical protein [Marispirochaeta aestuarii]